MSLAKITRKLAAEVRQLEFADPVAYVYSPLDYAWKSHEQYLTRYGNGPKKVVLVGMNPGPFGMLQTGVPFGEIAAVRDWMGIEAKVKAPEKQHPKRPIEGFACKRSEVSGRRLWGWAAARFGTAERFFEDFFVINYVPLAFLEATGRNRTPDKLPKSEREPLFKIADSALRRMVEVLAPKLVVGIGNFAHARCLWALAAMELRFGRLPHPSPASPQANRGWEKLADEAMQKWRLHLL